MSKGFRIIENKRAPQLIENLINRILWNGWIKFSYDNYIVIASAAFLESNDLRIGSNYSATENFCSIVAIFAMAYTVILPILILIVYWTSFEKITQVELPGNKPQQNRENFYLYLKRFKETEAKRMNHGVLLEAFDLRKVGARVAILTPFLDLLRQLILSVTITRLIRSPVLCVYIFNFNFLFYLMYQL